MFPDRVTAETSYDRDGLTAVPVEQATGWRIGPCDVEAVCVEFVTPDETYRVLLDTSDEHLADLALRRVLGPPLPQAS